MGLLTGIRLKGAESEQDEDYIRAGTRTYLAWFDIDSDENYVRQHLALTVGGTPIAVNDPHPTDSQQVVTRIRVRMACEGSVTFHDQFDDGNIANGTACYQWEAELSFGLWNPLEHAIGGNPLSMPTRFRFEGENVPIALFECADPDTDGNRTPIKNSANDYFDPPIEGDNFRLRIVVNRNEVSPDFYTLLSACNKINAAVWNGFPERTVKLAPMRTPIGQYSQVTGQIYYPMEYVFEVNFDGWDYPALDAGYRHLETRSGVTYQAAILLDGQPATAPVLLNGSGQPLPLPINPGDVNIIRFQIYPTLDYSTFGMDNLFTYGVP